MAIQAPKGTKDVSPRESYKWHFIEDAARDICRVYGFNEVRTPVIEHTELFLRGIGDTTDVVQKEMYTFLDKGERSITLKPEGTAGVGRMFVEQGLFNEAQPTKMYYLYCPVFRYEKPQAGRLREHHQFGVEVYGAPKASADAECISLAFDLLSRLGVKGLSVNINSIGCPECRPKYNAALKAYLSERYDELCPTCKERLEKNPLRILDCKEEKCKEICANAPKIIDCICGECAAHFEELKACLDAMGIPYKVDPMIVRGLDYYTKTVFEIIVESEGFSGTVCGGGRYDGLLKEIGGVQMPGVGFGMGMERLLLVVESFNPIVQTEGIDVYIAPMGEAARREGFKLAGALRKAGISAEFDQVGRSFKAQMKFADKLNAKMVALLGEDELKAGTVTLKNMREGAQSTVNIGELADTVKRSFQKEL